MPRASNLIAGKYRLVEPIGEGSMGSVWKAKHEALDRPFAVKFLKDHQRPSDRLEDRFVTEARLSAAVRHRSIVDVVDFGRTEEGTPYMVMEHLDGMSLAWRLNQPEPLRVRDALVILQQALAGLEAVHRAGILHRDLKPENIVLVSEEGEIVAKLIDFGISRPPPLPPATDHSAARTRLTMPGTTVGTPWYMAPEQAQALPTMDHRADVYAAAVILYEACAGRLPFEHDDLHMLLLLVANGGAAPLATHRPDLPVALSDVLARAMHPNPEARFESAAAFAQALRLVSDEVPATALCRQRQDACLAPVVTAPPPVARPRVAQGTKPPSGGRWPRGLPKIARPVLWASGAVAAAAALVLLVAVGGDSDATPGEQSRGVHQSDTHPRVGAGRAGGSRNIATARAAARANASGTPGLSARLATQGVPPAEPTPPRMADDAPPTKKRAPKPPPEVFRNPGF